MKHKNTSVRLMPHYSGGSPPPRLCHTSVHRPVQQVPKTHVCRVLCVQAAGAILQNWKCRRHNQKCESGCYFSQSQHQRAASPTFSQNFLPPKYIYKKNKTACLQADRQADRRGTNWTNRGSPTAKTNMIQPREPGRDTCHNDGIEWPPAVGRDRPYLAVYIRKAAVQRGPLNHIQSAPAWSQCSAMKGPLCLTVSPGRKMLLSLCPNTYRIVPLVSQ